MSLKFLKIYYMETLISQYDSCLQNLVTLFPNNKQLHSEVEKTLSFDNEKKIKSCQSFCSLINDSNLKNQFKNRKVKLFSSKDKNRHDISTCLFKNVSLKKVLNKESDDVKNKIWDNLHLIYIENELHTDTMDKHFLEELVLLLNEDERNKKAPMNTNKMLEKLSKNQNLNSKTKNMVTDILSTIQNNEDQLQTNPVNAIMNITQDISEKYKNLDDININELVGNIADGTPLEDFDFNSIIELLKNNEQKDEQKPIVIDQNFSTSMIKLGEDVSKNPFKKLQLGDLIVVFGAIEKGKFSFSHIKDLAYKMFKKDKLNKFIEMVLEYEYINIKEIKEILETDEFKDLVEGVEYDKEKLDKLFEHKSVEKVKDINLREYMNEDMFEYIIKMANSSEVRDLIKKVQSGDLKDINLKDVGLKDEKLNEFMENFKKFSGN